jgi:hypothetical protein
MQLGNRFRTSNIWPRHWLPLRCGKAENIDFCDLENRLRPLHAKLHRVRSFPLRGAERHRASPLFRGTVHTTSIWRIEGTNSEL